MIDFFDPDWSTPVERRLVEAAFLVTQSELPGWVLRQFRVARRCYGLGMYDATWIFLRALIEAVSFHVPAGENVRSMAEQSMKFCLDSVERNRAVPPRLLTKVRRINRTANLVIHGKRQVQMPTERDTLQAIRDVVDYCERLCA